MAEDGSTAELLKHWGIAPDAPGASEAVAFAQSSAARTADLASYPFPYGGDEPIPHAAGTWTRDESLAAAVGSASADEIAAES